MDGESSGSAALDDELRKRDAKTINGTISDASLGGLQASQVLADTDAQPGDGTGSDATPLLVPDDAQRKTRCILRWSALAFACVMLIGLYVAFDYPAYMENQIKWLMFGFKDKIGDKGSATFKYGLLYSIYSFPNIILPFFGGIIIDRIGVNLGNIVFSSLLCIGQLLCAFSVFLGGDKWNSTATFVWMLIGRFIFALGGDNLSITQKTTISKVFMGRQLSFALGLTISTGRLGSVTAGWLLPPLVSSTPDNLFVPIFVPAIFCLVGVLCALALMYIDKKMSALSSRPNGIEIENANVNAELNQPKSQPVRLQDMKNFTLLYWLICVCFVMDYLCMMVFFQFSNGLLQDRFQVDENNTGRLQSLPFLMSAIITPFVGILVDKIGRRQWLLLGGAVMMLVAHIIWLTVQQCPEPEPKCSSARYVVPLVLMGLFYSCFGSILWPCIPLVVEEKLIGSAFGVAVSAQNLGLFLFPMLISTIIGHTQNDNGGYFWASVAYVVCGLFCVCVTILVIRENKRQGDPLGRKTQRSSSIIAH